MERLNVSNYLGSETAVERSRLWAKTLCTFEKQPWWGVGAGNWATHFTDCNVYGLYSVELNDITYQRPHNDFLWILSENGLPGLGLYLAFWGLIIGKTVQMLKSGQLTNPLSAQFGLSLVVALLVVAFFSFPKERIELLIWTYTILAFLDYRSTIKPVQTNAKPVLLALLFFIMLGAVGAIYTSYQRIQGERQMQRVYAYWGAKQWPQLLEACTQAQSPFYSVDPHAVPIDWYRGMGHFSQGRFAKAKTDFERALSIAPYNQYCWNDLGSCWEKLGQRNKAEECYLEALRISPLFDDPLLNLAILSYKRQDYPKALFWLGKMQDQERAKPYEATVKSAMD